MFKHRQDLYHCQIHVQGGSGVLCPMGVEEWGMEPCVDVEEAMCGLKALHCQVQSKSNVRALNVT